MRIACTSIGYESIALDINIDFEANSTVYAVTDMRTGHYRDGRFDTYKFETPCEARDKYKELAAEFEAEHKMANGKEVR